MTAILSIEVEITVPALVDTAERLSMLRPSQLHRVILNWATPEGGPAFSSFANAENDTIKRLVEFAQAVQPQGTAIRIWYQGRQESFVI